MVVITGWLEFHEREREEVLGGLREVAARSRQDPGCLEYWWGEDVEVGNRFRFFECWESEELLEAHRSQPYEERFMSRYVSRVTGADAHVLQVSGRRPATA